jgi:hypothetical protein
MSWLQVVLAVPVAFLVVALIHDFFAGLGEERLWSDPYLDDPESFKNRAAVAARARRVTTTVTSINRKPGTASRLAPTAGIKAG